ncbi:MAG TPA: FAD-dependent oxidoreductase [Burkholderiaceae bacterium]|jgi:protoporphyrinogen oxidase
MMKRRALLAASSASSASWLAGCKPGKPFFGSRTPLEGGWLGATATRGHRLRAPLPKAGDGPLRRSDVLIIGGGVAGLACARALAAKGVDFTLLELEDETGGNARGATVGGRACPLGAHYLPLPGAEAREIYQLLEELGLVKQTLGRPVWDERYLCHSPQERLLFQGQWVEGLLPPALDAATRIQYTQFARLVETAQRTLGFAMPSLRAPWTAAHAALDAQSFAAWLDHQGLTSPPLRWYLDYCCRDDYGAPAAQVSAWAGLHYFASRHGFHPPGMETQERDAVLTWPEGNAWLTRKVAAPLKDRLLAARTVLRVTEDKHEVQVLAWDEKRNVPERWAAQRVVLATPLFIARHLLAEAPAALDAVVSQQRHAPWLVANMLLNAAPLERVGLPIAWDNVRYGAESLGYVNASHQSLRPDASARLLTFYWALPEAQRGALLQSSWQDWAQRSLKEMAQIHPELPESVRRIELMRWGHAMSIPTPGLRGSAALAALQQPQGRITFAHSDLAGYSVFEEAYVRGVSAARAPA